MYVHAVYTFFQFSMNKPCLRSFQPPGEHKISPESIRSGDLEILLRLLENYGMHGRGIERESEGPPFLNPRPHGPGDVHVSDAQFVGFVPQPAVQPVKGLGPLRLVGHRQGGLHHVEEFRVIVEPVL
jgi:hypothetical protein